MAPYVFIMLMALVSIASWIIVVFKRPKNEISKYNKLDGYDKNVFFYGTPEEASKEVMIIYKTHVISKELTANHPNKKEQIKILKKNSELFKTKSVHKVIKNASTLDKKYKDFYEKFVRV